MINNITIATADDITTLSDYVNIYPVDLSGTINTLSNALNWLEKSSYFRPIFFFNLLSFILGTHSWPLSVHFGSSDAKLECHPAVLQVKFKLLHSVHHYIVPGKDGKMWYLHKISSNYAILCGLLKEKTCATRYPSSSFHNHPQQCRVADESHNKNCFLLSLP